jgi:hypothetical protein
MDGMIFRNPGGQPNNALAIRRLDLARGDNRSGPAPAGRRFPVVRGPDSVELEKKA